MHFSTHGSKLFWVKIKRETAALDNLQGVILGYLDGLKNNSEFNLMKVSMKKY
jgi:hypothetical protein